MSTWTSNLYIQLIGTGEQSGTWGTTTNGNFQYVFEEAIVGRTTVSFSDANVTLSATQATTDQAFRNVYLNCTGTNTAQRNLIVPTINKNYIVENNTTGGFGIQVITAAGTGIVVPNGYKAALYVDGTNVVTAFNYLTALASPSFTNTSLTSGRVVYSTTGGLQTDSANLTFNGTTLTANTLNLTNALVTTYGGTGLSSYTAGDLPYYASGTALSKLGIGTSGYILTSSGTAPQWSNSISIGSITATSITDSGNLTFTGTGSRVLADFTNATVTNRLAFQTSTTNGTTGIYALPNGTSTAASWQATNAADPTNASKILIATNGSTDVQLVSGINGTGTYLPLSFYTNGSQQMRLDTSGNLGLGVTPSAWGSGKAIDISVFTGLWSLSTQTHLISNGYWNGTNYIYKTTNAAADYAQIDNTHRWYIAPSGTAGNTITFTQAMTLDASGRLLIGTTSASGSTICK